MKSLRPRLFQFPIVLLLIAATAWGVQADDIVIADFEQSDYGNWIVEGTAFGTGPAIGTLSGQMAVGGFLGRGLVNSFAGGDVSTGRLTSPDFKIERRYLRFLIGGGGWEGKTCINLIVDGKVVRTATGSNTAGGGSEELTLHGWDVGDLTSQVARIQIVDQESGGWGHINVDQIVLTDQKPPLLKQQVKHSIQINQRWLNFPIKTGGPKRKVTLQVDGVTEPVLDIELSDGEAGWWAPRDVGAWQGRTLEITVDRMPEDSRAFEQLKQTDQPIGGDDFYRERLRPQLHFSAQRGWNNDPNGLVFLNGKYHLFFQHNPYGWGWGNMHWGHAISEDLVHWQEQSETLYPDHFGPMFSGSAVVDWQNTSGFGRDGQPPLILFYTAAGNPTVQCLAYSTDHGKTFTKYDQNPILHEVTPGNRDPKVIYHDPSKQWVMVLYVEKPNSGAVSGQKTPLQTIQFFRSSNLRDWTYSSEIEGFYECPDLFPLEVDGKASATKWVLTAASSEYMIGSFDGRNFLPETSKLPGHRGRGFYAAQTFSNLPKGRRVQIGWLQAESPGMPFNQSMSLPLELSLSSTKDGPRLRFRPVSELSALRKTAQASDSLVMTASSINPLGKVDSEILELQLEFEPQPSAVTTLTVRGIKIIYDARTEQVLINGHSFSAPLQKGRQRMSVFVDRTSVELFASDGLSYAPFPVLPKFDDRKCSLTVNGGSVEILRLSAWELDSIWRREISP